MAQLNQFKGTKDVISTDNKIIASERLHLITKIYQNDLKGTLKTIHTTQPQKEIEIGNPYKKILQR